MAAIDHYMNAIILRGEEEAKADGSAAIEAHHLLLGIAAEQDAATHEVLTAVGLDRQAIRDALDKEFEQSLGAAGVSLADFDLPRASAPAERRIQLAASAKLAFDRAISHAPRKKDLQPTTLLLGIVQAQVGTVPRALALAGIDRADLIARLTAA